MKVADLNKFVGGLAELLQANGGKAVAGDFTQVHQALAPFQDLTLAEFAQLLRDADTFKREGKLTYPEPVKKAKVVRAKAVKVKPKTAADVEEVKKTAEELLALSTQAAVDPQVTYGQIDEVMNRIDKEYSADGLLAVAAAFGITEKLKKKSDAKARIQEMLKKARERQTDKRVINETLS